MVWRTIRSETVAAILAATCLAAPAFAQAPPPTPAPTLQSAPPANRLALVIGEAGYVGDPLQTAANDAALKMLESVGLKLVVPEPVLTKDFEDHGSIMVPKLEPDVFAHDWRVKVEKLLADFRARKK